jgi:uncharacterized protein
VILETIVSSIDSQGRPNFAPMGIELEGAGILLRPFRTAITWKNLQEVPEGVVHFTDNVLLFARCAVSTYLPPHRDAGRVRAKVLEDTCHWKEFVVESQDLSEDRGRFRGRIVAEGRVRDFAGFNRAKHAVIEGTILATRLHLLGRDRVMEEISRLRPLVDKTAGPEEREAFDRLVDYARGWHDAH